MEELELLPDIDEYLEQISDNVPVETSGLDELLYTIRAHTGLEISTIKIIVKLFFQEVRNQTLKGNIISIKEFGKFLIANPNNNTKKKIFIKFKPSRKIINKINEKH